MAAAVVCLLPRAGADEKARVPLYTNEDLRRVAGERGDTGVSSAPAVPPAPDPAPEPETRASRSAAGVRGGDGEAYWRAEAERVRRRVFALRQRQAALRGRLEDENARERGRRHAPRGAAPRGTQELQRQIDSLEERIRWEEGRLEERARRARALPGWLR